MNVRMPRMPVLSVRRRIFGGFAIVLLLLLLLAAGALHSTEKVQGGAFRVSEDSAHAAEATDVAVQVREARARVVQYVLTGTMDDQKLAQSALTGLDQVTSRTQSQQDETIRQHIARYRRSVDATIEAVETRRTALERLLAVATEIRTIVSATVAILDRETDPAILNAGARMAQTFGDADATASRFLAMRSPAEA